MYEALPPRPPSAHLALALAGVGIMLAVFGCTPKSNTTTSKPLCPNDQIYDSRTSACVRPQTEVEARNLATRSELEDLRDHGDYLALVDIHFQSPVDRIEFQSLLTSTSSVDVTIIEYFFPDISGGFTVPVNTGGITPSASELLAKSKMLVAARFSGSPLAELNALASDFAQAFDLARERYLSIEVRAKPSVLLAILTRDANVSYISVVNVAVQP